MKDMKAAKSIKKDILARQKADSEISSAFSDRYKARLKEIEIRNYLMECEIAKATNGKGILLENML